MSSMDLSAIERAKIDCAEKLFNSISTANVKYHKVATYQDLIDGMNAIEWMYPICSHKYKWPTE